MCRTSRRRSVSSHAQVKMEDAPRLSKNPKSECPNIYKYISIYIYIYIIWIRLARHNWPKSWTNIEDPVVPLQRNLYGHPFAGLLWERQIWGRFCWDLDGKKYRIENVCLFIGNKDYSCRYTWMTSKWLEESRKRLPCGRNWWNLWVLENQHLSLTTKTLDALNVTVTANESIHRPIPWNVRITNFLMQQLKSYQGGRNLTQRRSHCLTTWKDAQKCVERYCELANKKQSNCTKFQLLSWMIINFKEEGVGSCWRIAKQYDHKSSWNACT